MLSGLLLLKLSTSRLPVDGFATLSQFMLFAALLNMIAVGGVQNGLVRQAAAAGDPHALGRVRASAMRIWLVVSPALMLAILVGSGSIAHVLTDAPDARRAVIAITLLALAAGPGQIWCSLLTGCRQAQRSLIAQSCGLLTGTALAAILILQREPIAAIIGFAAGPLVAMLIAWRLARQLPIERAGAAEFEIRALLRYSIAFAATTSFSSIMLFGLRWFYRLAFGAGPLGYWLVANRISDMSTQLLGLFMIQVFVPHLATVDDPSERRRLMLRCWAAGAAIMGGILLTFSIAGRMLVHLFLSDSFLPALPAIRLYMTGDLFRVWALLAMYAAFANGRPNRYAGIEIGTWTLMAIVTVALTGIGDVSAPLYGYALAYGAVALIVTLIFAVRHSHQGDRAVSSVATA